jgi:sugar lactone lactonase YvrE
MGVLGSTNDKLSSVRYIHLDEDRGVFYVSDSGNNRIQKFIIDGNGTGVTVAGGNGAGEGLNQLITPTGFCVTRDGQTLYIADQGNNRITKWTIGASQGSVIAGNVTGIVDHTNQLLNDLGDVALDPSETYLYASDQKNHRVQRFRLQ